MYSRGRFSTKTGIIMILSREHINTPRDTDFTLAFACASLPEFIAICAMVWEEDRLFVCIVIFKTFALNSSNDRHARTVVNPVFCSVFVDAVRATASYLHRYVPKTQYYTRFSPFPLFLLITAESISSNVINFEIHSPNSWRYMT